MSHNNLLHLLKYGKMADIRQIGQTDIDIWKEIKPHHYIDIFNNILISKGFDLLEILIHNKIIEIDIFEYSSFEYSIFKSIAEKFPTDSESLVFLRNFIEKIGNINDEVYGLTLMGFCLEQGADIAVIRCLADAGCNTHYKNNRESNFIHEILRNNNNIKPEKGLSYLRFFIEEGVDVNEKNINGTTPLHFAIERNKTDLIELLLENGADANEQDRNGDTAFYKAVVDKQDIELYEKLVKHTMPNFELSNNDQLHILTEYIQRMYLSQNAIQLLKNLIRDGADVKQTSLYYGKQKSSLDWSAELNVEILKTIIASVDLDANNQDDQGNTILHKVCTYNISYNKEGAKEIYKKVKLLLEAGADINITNDKDQTALMLASQDSLNIKTVELLLKHKTDLVNNYYPN